MILERIYWLLRGFWLETANEEIILQHDDDLLTVRVPAYRMRYLPWLRTALIALLIALALIALFVIDVTSAAEVCDHHVTSGLVRNLIERGMARAFVYGEGPNGWIGYLIVWDPACQRAILAVYRATTRVWNFVTHYHGGNWAKSVKSAIKYAQKRLARDVVKVYTARRLVPVPQVPRWPGKPAWRPPLIIPSGGGRDLK